MQRFKPVQQYVAELNRFGSRLAIGYFNIQWVMNPYKQWEK
jgi:hypothetical protein